MTDISIVHNANDLIGIQKSFTEAGAAVIRGAIATNLLDDLREVGVRLIRDRLATLGQPSEIKDIDDGYRRLCAVSPKNSLELIRVIRENPAFYRLILSPDIERIFQAVIPNAVPHIVFDNCMMRIDGRDDLSRKFDWHYDDAFVAMSDRMIVLWIPITPVGGDMGRLRIVKGSHSETWPIRLRHDLATVSFSGPKRIELADTDVAAIEARATDLPDLEVGDIAILHGRLLHRSGHNMSDRARWICNPRFGDLLEPQLVNRGWEISRPGNPFYFAQLHPELVVAEPLD